MLKLHCSLIFFFVLGAELREIPYSFFCNICILQASFLSSSELDKTTEHENLNWINSVLRDKDNKRKKVTVERVKPLILRIIESFYDFMVNSCSLYPCYSEGAVLRNIIWMARNQSRLMVSVGQHVPVHTADGLTGC